MLRVVRTVGRIMASALILVAIDLTCRMLDCRLAMRVPVVWMRLTCELADSSQQFLCFSIFSHIVCKLDNND